MNSNKPDHEALFYIVPHSYSLIQYIVEDFYSSSLAQDTRQGAERPAPAPVPAPRTALRPHKNRLRFVHSKQKIEQTSPTQSQISIKALLWCKWAECSFATVLCPGHGGVFAL